MLKKLEMPIEKCQRCGKCRIRCPTREKLGWETMSPRARIMMAYGLLVKNLEVTDRLINSFYNCTTCAQCVEQCPSGIDIVEVIEATRGELAKLGRGPLEEYKIMIDNIIKTGNIFGQNQTERNKILKEAGLTPKKSPNLFFAGCVSPYKYKSIVVAALKVLNAMGVDLMFLGQDETCCGGLLHTMGLYDEFRDMANRNAQKFAELGIKKIITICPMCYTAFKRQYKDAPGFKNIEVQHTTQIIADLVKKDQVKFKSEIPMRVVYHDPCHLGRHSKIYEEPRLILQKIPGLKLVKMPFEKEAGRCCGGPIRVVYTDLAYNISLDIFEEASKIADAIITACPTCYHSLSPYAKYYNLKVYDIHEVLAMAMGLMKK
jgi:Fe-S oxidoreductase